MPLPEAHRTSQRPMMKPNTQVTSNHDTIRTNRQPPTYEANTKRTHTCLKLQTEAKPWGNRKQTDKLNKTFKRQHTIQKITAKVHKPSTCGAKPSPPATKGKTSRLLHLCPDPLSLKYRVATPCSNEAFQHRLQN